MVAAVARVVGAGRVGVRLISPYTEHVGTRRTRTRTRSFGLHMARALAAMGVLYLHAAEPRARGARPSERGETRRSLRPMQPGRIPGHVRRRGRVREGGRRPRGRRRVRRPGGVRTGGCSWRTRTCPGGSS